MEDSVALIVGANETLQDASKVGNSLKSIQLNLAGIKADAKSGEKVLNKTAKALEQFDISIYSDEQRGEVKDMYTLLSDVKGIYDDLGEDDQFYISEAIAGKEHANTIQAILTNWEQVVKMKDAYGSGDVFGSAERENDRYVNSVAGKLNIIKENMKSLVTTVVSTDMFKGMLDGVITVTEGLTKFISKIDEMGIALPTVIGLAGSLFKTIGTFGQGGKSVEILGSGFVKLAKDLTSTEGKVKGVRVGLNNLSNTTRKLPSSLKSATSSFRVLNSVQANSTSQTQRNTEVTRRLSTSIQQSGNASRTVASSMQRQAKSTVVATAKNVAFNAVATITNGLLIGGTVMALSAVVKGLDEYVNRYENAIKVNEENIEVAREERSGLSENKKYIESIADEYTNLRSKQQLSNDEQARLSELNRELAETFPELVSGYDENNDPVINMRKGTTGLIKDLERAIEKKNLLIANETVEKGENAKKELNDTGLMGLGKSKEERLKNDLDFLENTINRTESKEKELNDQVNSLLKANDNNFGKKLETIRKQMEDRSSEYVKHYNSAKEKYDEIEKLQADAQEGTFAKVSKKTGGFKDASDEIIAQAREVTNAFNVEKLGSMENNFVNALSKSLKEGNIPQELIKIAEARQQLDEDKNVGNYTKVLNENKEALYEFFGATNEAQKALVDKSLLPPEFFKVPANELDAYLRSFGETIDSTSEKAQNLTKVYEATQEAINTMLSSSSWVENEKTGELNLDLQVITSIKEDPNVDEKLKKALEIFEQDGLTKEEFAIMFELNAKFKEGNGAIDKESLLSLQQSVDEALGEKTFDITALLNVEQFDEGTQSIYSALEGLPPEATITAILNGEEIPGVAQSTIDSIKRLFGVPVEQDVNVQTTNAPSAKAEVEEVAKDRNANVRFNDNGTITLLAGDADTLSMQRDSQVLFGDNGTMSALQVVKNGLLEEKSTTVTVNGVLDGVLRWVKSFFGFGKEAGVNVSGVGKSGGKEGKSTQGLAQDQNLTRTITVQDDVQSISDTTTTTPSPSVEDVSISRASKKPSSNKKPSSDKKPSSNYKAPSNLTGSLEYLQYSIDLQKELELALGKIGDELDVLDEKLKRAYGNEKIKLIEEQNKKLQEQANLHKKLQESLQKEQAELKKYLGNNGVKFDNKGNFTNYDELLLAKEKEVQKLEDAYNKNTENEGNKKKYEQEKQKLDDLKKALERYISIYSSDFPNSIAEWEKLQNEIKENQDLIEDIKEDMIYTLEIEKLKDLSNQYKKIGNQLDLINEKKKYAYGKEKLDLINKEIELLKEQQKVQADLVKGYIKQQEDLKKFLNDKGFSFNTDGDILNYEEKLKDLEKWVNEATSDRDKEKRIEQVEKIKESLEEYFDLIYNEVPGAKEEWLGLENAIKDAYKEQLEITKDIEDKILEVYKKQLEERKKLIDEELDKRLDALDKQQQAYNDFRKEQDEKKELDEQKDVLDDLQQQIVIASKDTSQAGKKKLKELMDRFEEEQKRLDEIMQQQMDDRINSLFDKQKELLEKEAELEKEKLDEKYSEENLQQIVKDVLLTGQFVDINGEIKSLQDVLVDFVNEYEDGMSAVGDVIKNELVTNLQIAQNTMKDLAKILEEMDLSKITGSPKSRMSANSYGMTSNLGRNLSNPIINFNKSLIEVKGDVTKDTLPQLNNLVKEVEKRITKSIVDSIRR